MTCMWGSDSVCIFVNKERSQGGGGVLTLELGRIRWGQAFSQRGVRVSFGHSIADFGHPNIHIFVYNAMG